MVSQLGTSNKNVITRDEDEFFIPFRGDDTLGNQQQFVNLEAENTSLRNQLQSQAISIHSQEHHRNIIDKLREDNEMLSQALNQLTHESDEVKKREAEAAEEVTYWSLNIDVYLCLII